MKLLDRYTLRTFFAPWLYSLLAFIMVIIVFDLFSNMDDFVEAKTPITKILLYYLAFLPSQLVLILPLSLLLGVLYSLYQLTRNNEITAMRASGMSLYRVVTPMLIVGLLFTLIVGVVNETVAPRSSYWTSMFLHSQKGGATEDSVYTSKGVAYHDVTGKRTWMIGEFDLRTHHMKDVTINQVKPDGEIEYSIAAKRTEWLDERWWFHDVTIQKYSTLRREDPIRKDRMMMTDLTETPEKIIDEIKNPEFMSSVEMLNYIKNHPNASEEKLARVKTSLHGRLAMPWMCLIVAMLGVPFGTQTARKGAFLGILLCFVQFFAYFIMTSLFDAFGKSQAMHPIPAAWTPNAVFFTLGCAFIYRMR